VLELILGLASNVAAARAMAQALSYYEFDMNKSVVHDFIVLKGRGSCVQ